MIRTLILARHGESQFNAENRFTGALDVDLTERGVGEALRVAALLQEAGLAPAHIFSSSLSRAKRSARLIAAGLGRAESAVLASRALDERDYGELTGLNKDEARARWGEAQVRAWRRSYDVAPPRGESLRDTVARVVAFYVRAILPAIMRENSALVVAHGNTLRALTFVLDDLTPDQISDVEFATGAVIVYGLAADTSVVGKRLLGQA